MDLFPSGLFAAVAITLVRTDVLIAALAYQQIFWGSKRILPNLVPSRNQCTASTGGAAAVIHMIHACLTFSYTSHEIMLPGTMVSSRGARPAAKPRAPAGQHRSCVTVASSPGHQNPSKQPMLPVDGSRQT